MDAPASEYFSPNMFFNVLSTKIRASSIIQSYGLIKEYFRSYCPIVKHLQIININYSYGLIKEHCR